MSENIKLHNIKIPEGVPWKNHIKYVDELIKNKTLPENQYDKYMTIQAAISLGVNVDFTKELEFPKSEKTKKQ